MSKEAKRSNMAIWKINRDHPKLAHQNTSSSIQIIIQAYNDKEDTIQGFSKVSSLTESIEDKLLEIYHKPRTSNGWESFIGDYIDRNLEAAQNIFYTRNNDFLCFIYDGDDIFLITAGAGYHTIQEFIDDSFPLEVSKRLFVGDFNHADTRTITGVTYARSENYRRNYSFSRQEAFGKVWKKLSGRIDPGVIKKSPELSLVIDPKRKINAEMKSSFTFRKSVTILEVINLVNALQKLPKLSKERKERFKFLDTLQEVKIKEQKEKLWADFYAFLRTIVMSADFKRAAVFDFCHPSDVFDFLSGCNFKIDKILVDESDNPTAPEVLKVVVDNGLVDVTSNEEFRKSFERLSFSFSHDSESTEAVSTDLYKYFHGEVPIGSKVYFLIDGKWYEAQGTFIETLTQDFISEIFDDGILIKDVPFIKWTAADEDGFNIQQSKKKNFYHGDKIFLGSNRGLIELFDLLHVTNDTLYIIQVKDGFGASMRDACSQIQMAAEVIEQDLKANKTQLKSYYSSWVAKNPGVTEATFLSFFTKRRVYILGCSTNQKFNKTDFQSKKLNSQIAKFEVLGIAHDSRNKGYNFRLQHIAKK